MNFTNRPIPVGVPKELLRRLFDAMDMFAKVDAGLFSAKLYWQGKTAPSHLPLGSSSQIWEYVNREGRMFARVHCYRDATGGLIGRPDPKYLRINEVALYAM